MAIRWKQSDINNLNRLARNFNAKISREIKKGIPPEALPDKIKPSKIKKEITERKEYNNLIKEMNSFIKSKNVYKTLENGTIVNEWYYKNTQKKIKKINKQREIERQQLENSKVFVNGQELINVQRVAELNTLRPLNTNLSKKNNFKEFAKYVDKEVNFTKKDEMFIENLVKSWYKNLSSQQARILQDKAKKIGGKILKDMYLNGYEEIDIDYSYQPHEQSAKFENINSLFDNVINNKGE